MSLTLKGTLLLLIAGLLRGANLDVPDARLADFVEMFLMILGAILSWYGRVRKGDITWLGFRK